MAADSAALVLEPVMTTLVEGPENREYVVHKDLLCENLRYFELAYKTPMKEATSNIFELDDIPELAMKSLIMWLYTDKVCLDPGNLEPLDDHPDLEAWKASYIDGDDDFNCDKFIRDQHIPQNDTDSENESIDYEYDSGSESEDICDDLNADILPHPTEVEGESEASLVRHVFPDSLPSELDEYQLGVLIQLYTYGMPDSDVRFVPKWKSALEQMHEGSESNEDKSPDLDVYDCLVDLYILADRFDSTLLGYKIIFLLDMQQYIQMNTLHGRALPTFQTVKKAVENLPASSQLRQWLLYIFAYHWRPSGDSPEQVAARDLLPKDFLLDLALTTAERVHFTAGDQGIFGWRELKIDHNCASVCTMDPVRRNRGR